MERWRGVLKVPIAIGEGSRSRRSGYYRVAASLCLSPSSSQFLAVPGANAIFYNGDRIEGSGNNNNNNNNSNNNPVIERLCDVQNIADILASKFGDLVNAWVIEAAEFNGPFAVYGDFVPSLNRRGEPTKSYSPNAFPASTSTLSLLSYSLHLVKASLSTRVGRRRRDLMLHSPSSTSSYSTHPLSQSPPKTFILGFSKGGTVLNQLLTELAFTPLESSTNNKGQPASGGSSNFQQDVPILPSTNQSFLNSIAQFHYVDVGLNAPGAYVTDPNVIDRFSKRFTHGAPGIRFVLHGTPRQWCDSKRPLIRQEKDKLFCLLQSQVPSSGGKLHLSHKFYFADRPPDLQMHFEVIECIDVN